MALSRIGRGRGRRPRLRVVSHSLGGTPRHVVAWTVGHQQFITEHWSESEWEAMAEAERPEAAAFIPNFGYMVLRPASNEEFEEANEQYWEEIGRWKALRGLQS